MKVVAISGSYRIGMTTNRLIEQAAAGLRAEIPDVQVDTINLVERNIRYCTSCLTCFRDDPAKRIARCPVDDDMQAIYPQLDAADGYIFGCPVFDGSMTGILKVFIERITWVLSSPTARWPLKGCPRPRNPRKKAAILLLSAGLVPVWLRFFCDDATRFMRGNLPCFLNAKLEGSLFAGGVGYGKTNPDSYFTGAQALGRKLGRTLRALPR